VPGSAKLVGIWADRADPGCIITFSATGDIAYEDCRYWRWVGYSVGELYLQLFNAHGKNCLADMKFFGSQLNIERRYQSLCDFAGDFTLQRLR
jgi:hypothetical protein